MGFVANFIAFQQCKSFENRLRFDKFRDCLKVGSFLRHIVVHPIWHTVLPPAVLLCSISTARHVRGCHGPSRVGIWTPYRPNRAYVVPWPHQSPYPKQHLDQFSRFCWTHNRDSRQTDRLTVRPRYSICNNRPHLRSTANLRRGLVRTATVYYT